MNGICVRKDDTKIIGQEGGSGDETTLIGVVAHFEVHTIQFSLHMQSGFWAQPVGRKNQRHHFVFKKIDHRKF